MLVAGHETTATGLSWAFRWLLETPGVMARLEAEIATAYDSGRLLPEKIAKLELLDATVRETLRLQPVVPMVGRVVKKPIKIGPHTIPAGVVIAPSIYLAHRRARTFPDPRRFDPDRFLRTKPSPYEWFPFGGGIRRCIGMAFALYEMKMVLAAVLSRVTLARAGRPTRVIRRAITLAPSQGLPVVMLDRLARRASAAA
jgi:cytochrome P450